MLRTLEIRDMLLIDRLDLAFQPGLNVLTGETGAGKSILLDSLGFVLGWRGRAELVRQGAQQGEVVAVFDLPQGHLARQILTEAGVPCEDELILRRVNTSDGRKTAWINDRRASGEVLRAVSETLVELHGQHDDRGFLDPKGHRAILDQFADHTPLCQAVSAAWSQRQAAKRALGVAEAALEKAKAEESFLRHAVAELDKLAPEPGEEASLDVTRRMMQSGVRIREDVARALALLGPDAAEGAMSDAVRWLDGVADQAEGRLEAPMEALTRAFDALSEAQAGVEAALEAMEFDPFDLERTEERLFAIRGLARKHSVAPDDLADFADELGKRLKALDAGAGNIADLQKVLGQSEEAYRRVAEELSQARRDAAARLDQAVSQELAPLKMERARFATAVTPEDPSADGVDAVEFTVATNPGAPAGPLGKIASGGELSRFMLALKVCLSETRGARTLIFDEIDRGVGGATADAVGRRLASLAEGGQVLVVTHSPQVAALGAYHWRVEKRVEGEMTLSTVVPLADAARVDEIARMVAGDRITDEARGAARALLSASR
jgi:DNA repair protein RecN (Recombination protein N)